MVRFKGTVVFLWLALFVWQLDGQTMLYECPTGWEDYVDHCYRFIKDPPENTNNAKSQCSINGAYGLSINSDGEHNFVVNTLRTDDSGITKQTWWTSGRRISAGSAEFYWEGDGTKIESFVYWLNDSIPQQEEKNFIQYYYDGYEWGWILSSGGNNDLLPYICEIPKEDIYKITDEDRGPDYGVDNIDEATIDRGPTFIDQPQDTVYEPQDIHGYTYMDCYADAYPAATYSWHQERAGQNVTIDPSTNDRYTLINGRLIIHEPSAENQDDGRYQCTAGNTYGTILSNVASLSFGYLQDFPKSPRAPVQAVSYKWTIIECNPPSHYPEVLYTWYKNDIYNFIRPELKSYIFISHDGRLYFSEVTADDIGNYYCLVYKPGQALGEGKVSMPTELQVVEGSPGTYEPEMGSGFPLVYPNSPKVGDTVRLECWASGTSRDNPLQYTWDKIQYYWEGGRLMIQYLPLPNQARLSDHNRVITIPLIQTYDAGAYLCSVTRLYGQTINDTLDVTLQARPYFTVELQDQFADIGSDLRWRCEANGDPQPTYTWMKNAAPFNVSPEDADRITISNNVLYINNLDPKDDGMYQCMAANTHGSYYSTAQLQVLSFAPNFNKYPLQPNQFATAKGNTTLFCRPESAPYPAYADIIWYKNGGMLNPGEDEASRVRKMPNGNIFINSVEINDQGTYRCHVSNVYGEADTTGNLTVLDTTTITQPPLDTNIVVNSSNFLHCMASYNPELDVTYVWYHGDILVDFELVFRLGENKYEIWFNPHYKRGTGIYNGGLYIMNAQFEHSGQYTCHVESASGYMSRLAYVNVLGPPSEPAGVYVDDNTVTTSSVMLQWKAAGNNGGTILSYVIEAYNFWEGFWRILITNVRVTPDSTGTMRYNMTSLQAYSTYTMRVRAENSMGTSIPSKPTGEFTTGAIVPDVYPSEVGGGGGKVGELTITWKPLPAWEHNGPGIGYIVRFKNDGDDEWDEVIDVPGDVGRFVALVGEENYYLPYEVTVQAYNDIGNGPMSPVVTIRSAMGLPTIIARDLRAQPFNSTACLVHWDPVEDSREVVKGKLGGYRISYWMECCEDEQMAPRTTIVGQAAEGIVIGLYPDTPYYFDVMVWNEAGNGPKSQFFVQRTLRQAPIDMPVEVQLERRSDHSIYAKWRGVSTAQSEEPLEGYKVRIWADGEHLKYGKDYDAEKEVELYIDDLAPNVMYKLRVYAYSRGGMGAMSYPTLKFTLGGAATIKMSCAVTLLCVFVSYFTSANKLNL